MKIQNSFQILDLFT